jgi:ankyrin repeat protein
MTSESEFCDQDSLDILLARAVWDGNPGAVRFLLDQGASPISWAAEPPGDTTYGLATISLAVMKGKLEIVQLLMDTGIVIINEKYGAMGGRCSSPIIFAAQCSSLEMVDRLISYGALLDPVPEKYISLDSEGDYPTALIAAIIEKRHGMVQYLIHRGASIEASLAEYPAINSKILDELLSLGGNPHTITHKGLLLLDEAKAAKRTVDVERIEHYIQRWEYHNQNDDLL